MKDDREVQGEKVENQMNKYKRVTNNTPGKKRSQRQARENMQPWQARKNKLLRKCNRW